MKIEQCKFLVLAFFLIGSQLAAAEDKNIVIGSELATNAEMLKVKLGMAKPGKTWNFQFGDYAVRSSKMGPTVSNSEYAGLGDTTRGSSRNEFGFVLGSKTSVSAELNAAFRGATATRTSRKLPDVILDRDEVKKNTYVFAAEITISNDNEEVWDLMLEYAEGTRVAAQDEGLLTNGSRSFAIVPASSATGGKDTRTFPALGYEFLEDGVSIAAVQYFGGGAFGFNKNIIWLGADLDADMKLVLAAAMAAILQVKVRTD